MIRVGIVGCGRLASVHLTALRAVKDVEAVGVADADPARAQAFAAAEGIPVFAPDLDRLIALARPDAIHIATPPSSHVSLAQAALAAGCHVLIEKPLALSADDARRIADAVPKGRVAAVCHNHIFDPWVREALARVAAGRLGEVACVAAFHGTLPGAPPWVSALPSGPWIDDAPHPIYLARLFMGETLDVRAVGHQGPGGDAGFGEMRAVARHARGLSSIEISCAAVPYRNRVTVYGTKRTLEVDLLSGVLVESRPHGGGRLVGKGLAALDQASQILFGSVGRGIALLLRRERNWQGLRTLVAAFYEAIRTGGPSPVPIADGVRVMEIVDKIAAQLGTPPRG